MTGIIILNWINSFTDFIIILQFYVDTGVAAGFACERPYFCSVAKMYNILFLV